MIVLARIAATIITAALAIGSAYYLVWRVLAQQNRGPE